MWHGLFEAKHEWLGKTGDIAKHQIQKWSCGLNNEHRNYLSMAFPQSYSTSHILHPNNYNLSYAAQTFTITIIRYYAIFMDTNQKYVLSCEFLRERPPNTNNYRYASISFSLNHFQKGICNFLLHSILSFHFIGLNKTTLEISRKLNHGGGTSVRNSS